ncbi:putative aldouronate transport system substrate-binding protein [Evansella caseinilytica]|uniref:Putative aldouronate transport system substrate-binding protein n=1 Tax=Evansella caseinilytica TaxID=1503961 RepID=A0A1H3V1S8_9BACI|nr:extracellular solute-binding protein [Evansella caseinilytica]SDZ67975.1 putative aldouronate transport system substrate-binding protein [Evansella caseinilytica]
MTRKGKYMLAIVCSALLAFLLAACADEETGKEETKQESPQVDVEADDEVVELTLFLDHSWWPVREWSGAVPEEITKRTGVKLNIQVAADENQLPVMIASGDLPDLVFTYDQFDRMSDARISLPWNELIEQYTPTFEISPTNISVNTQADGNFYSIRNAFSSEEEWREFDKALPGAGTPGLAVREDILEYLGNPPLESLEDLENVLAAVKENYPDMIPLVMDINHIGSYLRNQMGIDVGAGGPWYERNGNIHYSITHPNYLEYYKLMNRFYRNGYITAENFTFSDDQRDDQLVQNGEAFAHMYVMRVADENNTALENQGKDFTFKLITKMLTEEAVFVDSMIGWSGVFITTNNSNPEKSIQLMEFLLSEDGQQLGLWGIEGEHWTMNEEGYPDFQYNTNDSEYTDGEGIYWWGLLGSSAVNEGLGSYVPGTQGTEGLIEVKNNTLYRPEIGLIRTPADSDEQNIENRLDEMIKNEETRIYLADSEEQAVQAYDDMLETAKGIGMTKLEEWATEEYQQVVQNFK